MSELRQRMIREMELRDFAENTQKAYLAAVEGLVRFYMKPPDQLNLEQGGLSALAQKRKEVPVQHEKSNNERAEVLLQLHAEKRRLQAGASEKDRRAQASGGSRARGSPQGRRGAGQPEAPGPAEDHVFRGTESRRSHSPETGAHRQRKNARQSGVEQGAQGSRHDSLQKTPAGASLLLQSVPPPQLAVSRQGSRKAHLRHHRAARLYEGEEKG